jgi:tetratricopeptide (TPR) repeat protein
VTGKKPEVAPPVTRHASRYYWLSLLAFLLALLSKTSVVTLPFVLWLCVWWRRSRNAECGVRSAESTTSPAHSTTPSSARWLGDLRRLAPFLALALILGLITVWFQTHRAMSGNLYQRDSLGVRLLGGTWAVWFYLGKTFLPVKLNMIYPRWEVDPALVRAYVPALVWLGSIAVCWRFRRSWGRAVLFGLGCFFVTLLPVLGFFDMSFFVYARAADHLQYLALLGVIALVVGGASSRFRNFSLPFRLSAGVVVVVLSVLTWNRAHVFKGQESLWRDTLAKNPQAWAAYNNLGMATKNPVEEFNCYVKALRLNPNYVDAHNNLGVVLYQSGKVEEAIAHFREALRLYPGNAFAHNNLGGALSNLGKNDEALVHLDQAIQINPNYAEAYSNLGMALMRQGRMAEATKCFETSLRLNPQHPDTHHNLGNIAYAQDRFGDAEAHYRATLRARPDSFETHHNLAMALAALGRTTEAFTEFDAALKLKPDFAPAQYQIGELLLKQGNRAEAARWLAAAVRSQPASAEAHRRLGLVLAEEQQASEAIQHLREAVRLKTNWVDALNPLAWMLATQTDSKLRDGAEAVRLATQANQLTGGTNVTVLDTLAAAHAEMGQYPQASRIAQEALELARAAGKTNSTAQIEARLRLYEAGQPFHRNREANP